MAFQSSTSIASPDVLIDTLATFAAANGWTVESNTVNLGSRVLTLRKPGVSDYIHIYNTDVNRIRLRASVGYNSALPPGSQTGVTADDCLVNNLAGPYPAVWFFADGNEINVVVRRSDTTGAYSHFAVGVLTKYGSFAGGTFIDGTYFNATGFFSGRWDSDSDHAMFGFGNQFPGYVRADADGLTNKWYEFSGYNSSDIAHTGVGPLRVAATYSANQVTSTYDIARLINAADDNTFSGRSILQVLDVLIRRQGSPVYVSPIGYVANTRYVSLAKFDPEQELTIADETWMVFPVVRKAQESTVNDAPNASENNGYAIRKVL